MCRTFASQTEPPHALGTGPSVNRETIAGLLSVGMMALHGFLEQFRQSLLETVQWDSMAANRSSSPATARNQNGV